MNTNKTKRIVFGSKHSLRPKPQLQLCIKGVTTEQVEGAKFLGVKLDGQLSWSSYIDKVGVKIRKGMSVIFKSAFLTQTSTVLVDQALILLPSNMVK